MRPPVEPRRAEDMLQAPSLRVTGGFYGLEGSCRRRSVRCAHHSRVRLAYAYARTDGRAVAHADAAADGNAYSDPSTNGDIHSNARTNRDPDSDAAPDRNSSASANANTNRDPYSPDNPISRHGDRRSIH